MKRMPTFFISHGGGPCFFMDWEPADLWDRMENFLKEFPAAFPEKPKAIVIISGHWEEDVVTVQSNPAPPMLYDYFGFPDHTYQLKFPAEGSPEVAGRVRELLSIKGIESRLDTERGFDHGVFVPLMVAFPKADIPVVQVSMRTGYDPQAHIEMGQALEPLRDEGVVIIGSGMSFHNMSVFRSRRESSGDAASLPDEFDKWLREAVTNRDVAARNDALKHWLEAPQARYAHPEEEHLMPLHVVAGAAGEDVGKDTLNDNVLGSPQAAFQFG